MLVLWSSLPTCLGPLLQQSVLLQALVLSVLGSRQHDVVECP